MVLETSSPWGHQIIEHKKRLKSSSPTTNPNKINAVMGDDFLYMIVRNSNAKLAIMKNQILHVTNTVHLYTIVALNDLK